MKAKPNTTPQPSTEAVASRASGDWWELHHGDSFAGMRLFADKSIDVSVGDAPYSEHVDHGQAVSGRRTGQAVSGRRTGQAVIRKEQIGNVGHLKTADIDMLCAELVRVTRRWIVSFCAWEQSHEYERGLIAAGGRYVRTCAWAKPDSTPQLTGDRPATWGECIVVGYGSAKGALRWNGGGKRGLYTHGVCRGHERSEHPTQKPLSLMRELLEDFTDPKDLVLDPFAGSGSTGVACGQLGRRFVGFELDAAYYAIACRRLRGEAAIVNPAQPSLFEGVA